MQTIVRETINEDFIAVSKLLQHPNIAGEIKPYKFDKILKRNRGYCFVAEADGKVIGTIFGTHDGGSIGYVYKLVVDESQRRQKVATKLVQRLLEKFDKEGIPLVFAHTGKTNEASLKLLLSLGFEIRDSHYLVDKGYKSKNTK